MSENSQPPLILTLKLEQSAFEFFDRLRKQHFPRHRNFISAHVTMFHALPAAETANIRQTLQDVCAETEILQLSFPRLRFLGKGVAAELECAELNGLRGKLANEWKGFLTAQDAQKGYRPHITFQNKVQPNQARDLFEELSKKWQPLQATGEGLILWEYLGGPWKLIEEFGFAKSANVN